MLADPRIQEIWLRMLSEPVSGNNVNVERIDDGYHAVVLTFNQAPSTASMSLADYKALDSLIPNIGRTRAVYLNSSTKYQLPEIENLRNWAGDLALDVENGTRHAFVVVDQELIAKQISERFRAANWTVDEYGQDLRVGNGTFTEVCNILRAIVRIVLSRSTIKEGLQTVQDELAGQFALDAELFGRFERHFEKLAPAVFDHYFVAYPESSCMAAGWDYWQVSGKTAVEAEQIFRQAMEEFETFLATPSEDWVSSNPMESGLGAEVNND
jgi:hypothetical protein